MIRRTTATVVVLAASVAMAGCGSAKNTGTAASAPATSASTADASGAAGGGASGGPSGGVSGGTTAAPGGPTAGGGTGGPCVVGTWRTTGLSGALTGNGVTGTVKGGSGVVMTVAPSGSTKVTFDGMQPVSFTYAVGGGSVAGTFSYGGSVTGTMKLPAGTVTSGTWSPTGTVNFAPLTVTVDVLNPAVGKVADKQPLADFVGSDTASAGAAVDAQPLLRTGQFSCTGSTLTIAPPAGGGGIGTWTMTKG